MEKFDGSKQFISKDETIKPEVSEQKEGEINFSDSAIGFRIFKIGEFDQKSLEQFTHQVETVKTFSEEAKKKFENPPEVTVITNSDLSESGKQIFIDSHLTIVQTENQKARRRAELAKRLIGEKSVARGDFSYADMLNSLKEEVVVSNEKEKKNFIFISSDLAKKSEILLRQITAMKILYDIYSEKKHDYPAMIGSLLEGVHNPAFVQKVIEGVENIGLENLHKVFPNNSISMVPSGAEFSGISDNSLAGRIEVAGKNEPIGGNEDFFYGLKEMIYSDKDVILLIDPYIAGERSDEVKGVESKYQRRQAIYHLYAQRFFEQATKRGKISPKERDEEIPGDQLESFIEDVIDKHLFFARVDNNNQVKIILTKRQQFKRIKSPL